MGLACQAYAARCARLWAEAHTATADVATRHSPVSAFGKFISLADKLERERRTDLGLERVEARLRRYPVSAATRAEWRGDLLRSARELAGDCLGYHAPGLDLLFTPAALEATRQFIRQARAFAPRITDQSLFQALRNLWVVHSVQLFLEADLALSPPIFAYSMLYPWTDNCLDDPQLSRAAKIRFGDWLDLRLAGAHAPPPDPHSTEVSRLVALIEGDFPRAQYPEVYRSLRAIHHAQVNSLQQQAAPCTLDDDALLRVSILKGGTSVLADAYLVRGGLADDRADFMFDYGVLLQFMDDLQDFRDDLAHGHTTLFTRQAKLGPLDGLTSRLWSFVRAVLWGPPGSASPPGAPLKSLIEDNLRLLLVQTVARNQEFFTPAFARELEAVSPVRFCYLATQEKTLASRYSEVLASLRRRRKLDSLFEMLD